MRFLLCEEPIGLPLIITVLLSFIIFMSVSVFSINTRCIRNLLKRKAPFLIANKKVLTVEYYSGNPCMFRRCFILEKSMGKWYLLFFWCKMISRCRYFKRKILTLSMITLTYLPMLPSFIKRCILDVTNTQCRTFLREITT